MDDPVKNSTSTKGTTIDSVQVVATDLRTTGLGSTQVGVFYDSAIGTPTVPGDTVKVGLVASNDDGQRFALVEYTTNGLRPFRLVSGEWVAITTQDDYSMLQEARGIRTGSGWYLTAIGADNAPDTNPARHWLVSRQAAQLKAYSPDFTDASPDTYDLWTTTAAFATAAANISGAAVKAQLEALTGDNRLSISAIKDAPSGGSGGSGFDPVGASADLPAAPSFGAHVFVYKAFTGSNLGNANYAFLKGVFYKYTAADANLPAGWRPVNSMNALFGAPGISANDVTSDTLATARIASGGTTGDVLNRTPTGHSWGALARSWTVISGLITPEPAGSQGSFTAASLNAGEQFDDYEYLVFQRQTGQGSATIMIPLAIWEDTQGGGWKIALPYSNSWWAGVWRASNTSLFARGSSGKFRVWGGK